MRNKENKTLNFEKEAVKVSIVSIVGNIILSLLKLFAVLIAHSGALITDAVHSASDVFSSIIVIIGVKISSRDSDEEHPYGHERLECVAAIVLSIVLLFTGLFIGLKSINKLTSGDISKNIVPSFLALVIAIISILSKELMFHYTKYYAVKLDSGAVMADAWHHRSDALSSIGALIGVIGSRMGIFVMDSIASLVICIFIAKASYDIFKDAIDKMIDHSCDKKTEQAMYECVLAQYGVLGVDKLITRIFGNRIYVDIEIKVDGNRLLRDSHTIAENVHDTIEREFPKIKHVMIHVNPTDK